MNMRSEPTGNKYTVKLFADGRYVDTVTVRSSDAWQARTTAHAYTSYNFRGELAEYEVTEVGEDTQLTPSPWN